jgi:hypothetical protein
MSTKKKRHPGRPKKPDNERGMPVGLRLHPRLLKRLENLRSGRTWPAMLEQFADLAEGKTSAP